MIGFVGNSNSPLVTLSSWLIYVGDDDKLFYGDAHPSFKVCGKQPQIGWEGAPAKHQWHFGEHVNFGSMF